MKAKPKSTDNRKLMDRLAPDPAAGRLLGVLATSYEMQPEFFETDFLPTLLGLGAWDDRTWSSRIALEKHLAELEAASILVDARPYRGRPRSLRVEVEPVFFPSGRILHAKVLVAVYEDAVRLVFGSANLTEPGYRRNREIAAVLMASPTRPIETLTVREALRGLRELLAPWLTSGASQLCAMADDRLGKWAAELDQPDQWFAWSGGPEPLWRQVLARWPEHDRVEKVTIVSPFWSDEGGDGPIHKLVAALREGDRIVPGARFRLLTEAAPDRQGTYKPMLPESFAAFDAGLLGVSAVALAVDPRVPPEEVGMADGFVGTRSLHAKVVLFEGAETSLAYFGSANFTDRGWGFLPVPDRANIEAGLIIRRSGADRAVLQCLIPATTGEPVPLAGAAAGRLALPEASPEDAGWPGFVREILLAPSRGNANQLELRIRVEPDQITGTWRIGHLPAVADPPQGVMLFENGDGSTAGEFTVALAKEPLERLLREQEVQVAWWLNQEGRSFPVNVAAEARTALPISPGSGRPQEQHLIAYYQGRITWEELFPDPDAELPKDVVAPDQEETGGVDTSRIQSYVVREFVEALKGITDDLKAAAGSPKPCMRLAILGPVSPVALARRVLEAANRSERTPTAAGFQLVEILACLDAARGFPASSPFESDWIAVLDEGVGEVARMLQSLEQRHPEDLSADFRRYATAVRVHHQMKVATT